MGHEYDVVIVGGGPAGLSVATSAAERDLACLVVEKNEQIGYPVKTSGGSWYEHMINLGIDETYLNPITKVSIISPSGIEAIMNFETPVPCILDVSGAYQFLADQALQRGVEIRLNTRVTDVIMKGRFVSAIRAQHEGREVIFSGKVIVDASGVSAILAKKMGFIKKWPRVGVGAEYDVFASLLNERHSFLFVGDDFAPSGYGWIFPWKANRARVGIGIIHPDSSSDPRETVADFVENRHVINKLGQPVIKEKHFGVFPCSGPIKRTIWNGLIVVGDAGGLGSPLYGEGIRHAMTFGRIAGNVIAEAIQKGDVTVKGLINYEKTWRKMQGKNYRISLAIQKFLTQLDDRQWDKAVRVLRGMCETDPDLIVRIFRGEFSNRLLAKLFWKFPTKVLSLFFLVISERKLRF